MKLSQQKQSAGRAANLQIFDVARSYFDRDYVFFAGKSLLNYLGGLPNYYKVRYLRSKYIVICITKRQRDIYVVP